MLMFCCCYHVSQVVVNGRVASEDGTSAAAPLVAGLVSLLNEARLGAGKPPLGYLNPWLYALAANASAGGTDAFTDVTEGSNAISRMTAPLAFGFGAAAGWDPVTGLGTPRFRPLLESALAL